MTQEALKLALEALKRATNYDPVIARAITAIKEALARPEQEPVKYSDYEPDGVHHTTPPQRKPLTVDEVWQNDELMALNAELGCGLDLLMEVVEAIEAAHGIKENT